jgi:hypothetical protein
LTAAALAALWNAQAGTKKRLPAEPRNSRSKRQDPNCAYAETLGNIPDEAIGNQFRNTLA